MRKIYLFLILLLTCPLPYTNYNDLPPNVSYDSKTGVLSGVVVKPGIYYIQLTVSDSETSVSRKFKIRVRPNFYDMDGDGDVDGSDLVLFQKALEGYYEEECGVNPDKEDIKLFINSFGKIKRD